jgi:hypothetical protein
MNPRRRIIGSAGVALLMAVRAGAQERPVLPVSLEPQTRQLIEQLGDSLRGIGLPVGPLYSKAAEGKLKQATDAQIISAVRSLARRFGEIRASLGGSLDETGMSAAATAMSAGVPLSAIRGLLDAAGSGSEAKADFAIALVTITDLVGQRVPSASAVTAVQSLLARRAPSDQYARLRADVATDIGTGRLPEQAVRARTEAIVRTLPIVPPPDIMKTPRPASDARRP